MNFDSYIRSTPDFPKPGIVFRDFIPLLANGPAFKGLIDHLKARHADKQIDVVVGIEARGFILASALAYALGVGTVLIRKAGKLPHATHAQAYELEYGSSALEIQQDAFLDGQHILIVEDVLATELNGREKLGAIPTYSVLHY